MPELNKNFQFFLRQGKGGDSSKFKDRTSSITPLWSALGAKERLILIIKRFLSCYHSIQNNQIITNYYGRTVIPFYDCFLNKTNKTNKTNTRNVVTLDIKDASIRNLSFNNYNSELGPYLAGLIEGDGTIAVHDLQSRSTSKKYNPIIIVVFKKADLPLANYLQKLTNCGRVYIKPDRGYVL